MKYSICAECFYTDRPLHERIGPLAELRPDALEFWDVSGADVERLAGELRRYGLPVAACTMSHGWEVRLNAPYPAVERTLLETMDAMDALGCSTIIALAGERRSWTDSQKQILIENLKRLAEHCEKRNVTLVLEPLNSMYDHKGFYLDNAYDGFEIVECVNSARVKLLFDCYHMQIMQGNLVNTLRDHIAAVGHVHAAGVPGRHEPWLGETNYPFLIGALEEAGYAGYFGLEYFPSIEDARSLRETFRYLRGGD